MFDLSPDIRPFADALGWALSGGQHQTVAVARGLMDKARLLLLDETSLGLAPVIVQQGVRDHRGDPAPRHHGAAARAERAHGLSVADHGYVLETGKLALSGRPDICGHTTRCGRRTWEGASRRSGERFLADQKITTIGHSRALPPVETLH
jgi:ABC-type branched-subunit amino acid transport system ATPase component